MRHNVAGYKLGRSTGHRRALLRNMATALVRHERIVTTTPKAKALRPFVERLITLGKRGDLHARRLAAVHIHDHEVLQKLFGDLAERVKARNGGYTRILKLGFRHGDTADTALIELVDRVVAAPAEKTADKGKKAAPVKAKAEAKHEHEEHEDAEKKAKAPAKKAKAKDDEAPKKAKAKKPAKAKKDDDKPAKKPAKKGK